MTPFENLDLKPLNSDLFVDQPDLSKKQSTYTPKYTPVTLPSQARLEASRREREEKVMDERSLSMKKFNERIR